MITRPEQRCYYGNLVSAPCSVLPLLVKSRLTIGTIKLWTEYTLNIVLQQYIIKVGIKNLLDEKIKMVASASAQPSSLPALTSLFAVRLPNPIP